MNKIAACYSRFLRHYLKLHVLHYITGDGNLAVNRCFDHRTMVGIRCRLVFHYAREYLIEFMPTTRNGMNPPTGQHISSLCYPGFDQDDTASVAAHVSRTMDSFDYNRADFRPV